MKARKPTPKAKLPRGTIVFVTGTDTGVGKTLLTALLLRHLRDSGVDALAMKPFCCGGLGDVRLLDALQEERLPKELLNPFYFEEPVAPLVAARRHGRRIALKQVLGQIREAKARCEVLLVEGAGGLLAPLGEGYAAVEIIKRLRCPVVVAARNSLGTINHTLLTLAELRRCGLWPRAVVLMSAGKGDASSATNAVVLSGFLSKKTLLHEVGGLGRAASSVGAVARVQKSCRKLLRGICASL